MTEVKADSVRSGHVLVNETTGFYVVSPDHVSFGDFHLFLLSYFLILMSTLLTINLLQLHSSIVALDAP